MNPEVKPLWLTALRSEEFKQGKYKLRTGDDQYCCLGVLSELAVRGGVINAATLLPMRYSADSEYMYDGDICSIGSAVSEWSGLDYEVANFLIGLNDGEGKSFLEIADWIDENL